MITIVCRNSHMALKDMNCHELTIESITAT